MEWLKDLVSPAVSLFLANSKYLAAATIVLFLIWLISQRHQRQEEEESEQQRRQKQQRVHQIRQREDLQQKYDSSLQQQRNAHQHQLQQGPRQRQRRPPQIEHVSPQEPTSSSTGTQLRGLDGNSAVEGTTENAIVTTTAPADEVEGQTSEQPEVYCPLCENCQKFFRLHRSGPSQRQFLHSETLSLIRLNAMKGCSVCALISRKLKDRPVKANKSVAFTIEPWTVGWHLWSPYIDFRVIPVTESTSKTTHLSISLVEANT